MHLSCECADCFTSSEQLKETCCFVGRTEDLTGVVFVVEPFPLVGDFHWIAKLIERKSLLYL